ncbi:bifunctional alpha/beta hydrolase/class I SAM-dependent methyltransferase [Niveibacterium sp.]|uniref:bifunctional alpha/beta hydrolase/class I SAM-dependent methyltransferase n=1 Tax=Niveibacterium sp. TaxID=2017444 RepID=UPI0035AF78D8
MSLTQRAVHEMQFLSHDGAPLFYRHWPASGAPSRGAIILLHRGHEHSGRMAHLVDELNLPDFDFFAWDARGHGRSPGERGFSPSFMHSVADLEAFSRHVHAQHGFAAQDTAVVAQSVGAVIAATWVHDYAPPLRAQVLASPAFSVKLYVPLARPGLALMHTLLGDFKVTSYVKARYLTHDQARAASYDTDPLITRPISVNVLLGLYDAAERVVADAAAIHVPTQMFISGEDWVVRHAPQHAFFDALGCATKVCRVLPGFRHDTLGERDRAPVVAEIRDFVLARFAAAPEAPDLRHAHQRGHTFDEYQRLRAAPGLLSGAVFASMRLAMRTLGRLSAGMRLGLRTGFDSGSTLDYVYRNKPSGWLGLGWLTDRNYLNAIGWRGIRQRKLHLEAAIARAAEALHAAGQPLHLLDVAAGHGRYILDSIARLPIAPASIRLRDYSPINLSDGKALIAERGVSRIARFEQADAFDPASYASLYPAPTVAVVSGLYELFPDNTPVRRSLGALGAAVAPGGYLIYTGQPWHPQLELIARTLNSHRDGEPWVMRRRTQAELDQLVAEAGFEKIGQSIDRWGIFTVSIARRRAVTHAAAA